MPLSRIQPENYPQQLQAKVARVSELFEAFHPPTPEIFGSSPEGFRMRAEFRLWHEGDDLFYAMFRPQEPKTPVRIDNFPIADKRIQLAMTELLERVTPDPVLRRKLFQVEFLATLSGELLITLVYHRQLDSAWEQAARSLGQSLQAHVIGRARKQKLVVGQDYVTETLPLEDTDFHYCQYEQSFTQPNARVNIEMIGWARAAAASCQGGDLLELYCGNGNFTLPLSRHFDAVIATEVAKSSIKAALHNCELNQVDNVRFIRLAAEEVCQALDGEREFRRLRNLPQSLGDYAFSTIFVDPPRAGLDPLTEQLASRFDQVIYISCNPHTLQQNLQHLCETHRLEKLAFFDQFPYTDHMECGAFLRRR